MIQYVQNKSSNIVDWFSSLTGFEQIMLVLLALAVFRLGGIRRDLRSIYREIAQDKASAEAMGVTFANAPAAIDAEAGSQDNAGE